MGAVAPRATVWDTGPARFDWLLRDAADRVDLPSPHVVGALRPPARRPWVS